MHLYDRYQILARDAHASGDRIAAENYLQHAEHYFRIINAMNAQQREQAAEGGPERARGNGHAGEMAAGDTAVAGGEGERTTQPPRSNGHTLPESGERKGRQAAPAETRTDKAEESPAAPVPAQPAVSPAEETAPSSGSDDDGAEAARPRRRRTRRPKQAATEPEGGEAESGSEPGDGILA